MKLVSIFGGIWAFAMFAVGSVSCQRSSDNKRANLSAEEEGAESDVGANLFAPDGIASSATKPCADRTGRALPWEGSGACNGNLLVHVPLPTAAVDLYFNSLRSTYRFCSGNRWSMSTERFVVSLGSDRFGVIEGDGTATDFKKFASGTTYFAESALVTLNSLSRASSRASFIEQSPNGTKLTYKSKATRGAYPLQSVNDRNGNITTYALNSQGCVTSLKFPTGETVKFAYDGSKRLTTVTDAAGGKYSLSYSTSHDLNKVTQPDGRTWEFTYDAANGNLITSKSSIGEINQYFYVGATGVASATVNHNNWTTTRTYSATQVNTSTAFDYVTETFSSGHLVKAESNGAIQITTLDSDLRVKETEGPTGAKTQLFYPGSLAAARVNVFPNKVTHSDGKTIELVYDSALNVTKVKTTTAGAIVTVDRTFDGFGQLLKETVGSKSTQYNRDSRGNLLSIIDPNGQTSWQGQYDSSGNLLSHVNEFNQTTNYTYANKRLSRVTDHLGRTTDIDYQGTSKIAQISDSTGLETKFVYDTVGILRSTTNFLKDRPSQSLGSSTVIAYDPSGKVTSIQADALVNGAAMTREVQEFDPDGALFNKVRRTSQGVVIEGLTNGTYTKLINTNPTPGVQP